MKVVLVTTPRRLSNMFLVEFFHLVLYTFLLTALLPVTKMTITDELAAADANQIWWFKANPYSGSLPQPN